MEVPANQMTLSASRNEQWSFKQPSMKIYDAGNTAVTLQPVWKLRQRTAAETGLPTEQPEQAQPDPAGDDKASTPDTPERTKFGWVDGVFATVLVQIWGVMLFLRLSWIVGYAGIGQAIAIVLISSTITSVTTTSLSAIASNGSVAGGGAYYLISRSLGAEFGGAIGILFYLGNAVAISLYVVGFAEALLGQMGSTIISEQWDLRLVSVLVLVAMVILVFVGIEAVIKAQLLLLTTLILALASFFIGCLLKPGTGNRPASFIGWSTNTTGLRNFGSDYSGEADLYPESAAVLQDEWGTVTFATCLGVFFPAATGIMAGANISGDLKNPATDIPKGTFIGIAVSSTVYVLAVIFLGASSLRTVELPDGTYEGLLHDTLLMARTAIVPWLVYIGIYAATLSSALASLVGAPRILQAVARDDLFSCLGMFAKGVGRNDEPLPAYVLSIIIALVCIALGDLNAIAPLITNLFLASYCLVNCACLAAELSKAPGWRPSYRGFNKWSAGVGAVACFVMMFFLSAPMAVVTLVLGACLYYWVSQYSASKSWGSAMEGKRYVDALRTLSSLHSTPDHVKNWRPSLLVMLGERRDWVARAGMVHLARHLKKGNGLSVFASVQVADYSRLMASLDANEASWEERAAQRALLLRWLDRLRCPGFASHMVAPSTRMAAQSLLQVSGIGNLKPNILMTAMDSMWMTKARAEVAEQVGIVGDAFDAGCGVVMLFGCDAYARLAMGTADMAGVDATVRERSDSGIELEQAADRAANPAKVLNSEKAMADVEALAVVVEGDSAEAAGEGTPAADGTPSQTPGARSRSSQGAQRSPLRSAHTLPDLIGTYGREDFHPGQGAAEPGWLGAGAKQGAGKRIDVYWIDDDGGISVLLPYLLSRHIAWRGAEIRVFVAVTSEVYAASASQHVRDMMARFRLPFQVVPILTTGLPRPKDDQRAAVHSFDLEHSEDGEPQISRRTRSRLQLGNLIQERSKDADLVFVTLPVPRRGTDAALYLSWLWLIGRVANPRFVPSTPEAKADSRTASALIAANKLLSGDTEGAEEAWHSAQAETGDAEPSATAAAASGDGGFAEEPGQAPDDSGAEAAKTLWRQLDLTGCTIYTDKPVVFVRGNQQTVLTGDS